MSKTAPSLVTEIYSNAFDSYKFGYASAEAWVLVAVMSLTSEPTPEKKSAKV